MAARKKAAVKNESATTRDKAGDFKRLAEKRVPKAIVAIRSIGKLASGVSYEFTDEQAEKICDVLQGELDKIKKQFAEREVHAEGVSFEV